MAEKIKSGVQCALLLWCLLGQVAYGDVLRDRDNGPLTGIFGVPDSTESGYLLDKGSSAWEFSMTHASHSIDNALLYEVLYLDGETNRVEFRYRKGITEKLEVGIDIPYVQHMAGSLDSFIDDFHQLFGMPEGHRPSRGKNVLEFHFTDTEGQAFNIGDDTGGIGDARIFGGWQLHDSLGHKIALRFGVKLPTADSKHLHGSGGTDISLGVAGDVIYFLGYKRLNGFYRAHIVHLGEPEYLAHRHKEWVGFVSAGVGLQVSERVKLLLQAAARTSPYESQIRNIGDTSTTVTFGTNIQLNKEFQLSFGITEDADVSSAPDVAFQLALRYRGNN